MKGDAPFFQLQLHDADPKDQKSKRKENTFISLAVDPERRNSSLLPSPPHSPLIFPCQMA